MSRTVNAPCQAAIPAEGSDRLAASAIGGIEVSEDYRLFARAQPELLAKFEVAERSGKVADHMINDATVHPANAIGLRDFVELEPGSPFRAKRAPTQADPALHRYGELVASRLREFAADPNAAQFRGFPPPTLRDVPRILARLDAGHIKPIDIPAVLSSTTEYRFLLRQIASS